MLKNAWRTFLAIVLVAGVVAGCGGDREAGPPKKDADGTVWSGPTSCYGGCEAKPAPK